MKFFNNKKRVAIAIPVLLGLFATGVAIAAWASTASGNANAASTTSANSTITVVTPIAADDLYPGASKFSYVTINNPNAYPVIVTSISAGSSAALATPTCAVASVTTAAKTTDATGHFQSDGTTKTIAAGGTGIYKLTANMIANPDEGCKSRTFVMALTGTLASNA